MSDELKKGERVRWYDSRMKQERTGTGEYANGAGFYSVYVKPDTDNRHWIPKRKLRRLADTEAQA